MTAVKKAIREVYGETLAELGAENKNIVALDADVGSSSRSILFGKKFPDRRDGNKLVFNQTAAAEGALSS